MFVGTREYLSGIDIEVKISKTSMSGPSADDRPGIRLILADVKATLWPGLT
jgi:hypothetical protein